MSFCRCCGCEGTSADSFCGHCGLAIAAGDAHRGNWETGARRRWKWIVGGIAGTAVAVAIATVWFNAGGGARHEPPFDAALVEARVRSQLPPHVELANFHVTKSAPAAAESQEPLITTAFRAEARAKVDTFAPGRREGDVLMLSRRLAGGGYEVLTGTARATREGTAWRVAVIPDGDWSLSVGMPRSAFADARTIVAGSDEERAYREEQSRAVELQRQQQLAADALRRAAERQEELRRIEALDAERRRLRQEPPPVAVSTQRSDNTDAQPVPDTEQRITDVPVLVELPAGTEFDVRLQTALSSGAVAVEDRFQAVTIAPVALTGGGAIGEGAVVRGVVSAVEPASRTNRTARLAVTFDLITVGARSYPLRGTVPEIAGPGLKGDAKRVAVGSAVGAILGGLFGGAKGAVAGGAIGGGGTMAATEGKQIELPAGSVLRVRVEAPVRLQ